MSTDAPLPTPPATLAQQLDKLMDKTRTDHAEIVHKIGLLGLELFESDAEIMRALEAVQEGQARRASQHNAQQRVDTGRGLRATHYSFELLNGGVDFELDAMDVNVVKSARRI